ncbi:MAG: hypothetical protein IJB04_07055 [Oscillospiraceae bacterium]|nr:hypothetical protein [Oscillospiraceae bacterium]
MKKNVLILPVTLTAMLWLYLLAEMVLRLVLPQLIFPRLELTGVVLLCLAAQVAESYLAPHARHNYLLLLLLGALAFGLLPLGAGFVHWQQALVLAAAGAVALCVTTFLFVSLRHRLDDGQRAPLTPLLAALCLYLAVQPLRGVLL